MKWVIGFLVLSNIGLWFAVSKCFDAVQEWMDAMTEAHDEHQHVRRHGLDTVVLSGPPLSSEDQDGAP